MNRRGFTIIEMLIAVVILAVLALSLGKFAGEFSRVITKSSVRVVGASAASDRLELIRADSRYTQLVTLYGGGAGADTTGFPGYPQMRRITTMTRDQSGTPARDRITVTVRVIDPGLPDTISVSTMIASP